MFKSSILSTLVIFSATSTLVQTVRPPPSLSLLSPRLALTLLPSHDLQLPLLFPGSTFLPQQAQVQQSFSIFPPPRAAPISESPTQVTIDFRIRDPDPEVWGEELAFCERGKFICPSGRGSTSGRAFDCVDVSCGGGRKVLEERPG